MSVDVRDHIHLAETLGSSPEFSPIYKWTVRDRQIAVPFNVEIVTSLTGKRFDHAIEVAGTPVVYQDFYYEFKILNNGTDSTLTLYNRLLGLAGKRLYLVDNIHEADGTDHTNSVRLVRMTKLGDVPTSHMALYFFYIPVFLTSLEAE